MRNWKQLAAIGVLGLSTACGATPQTPSVATGSSAALSVETPTLAPPTNTSLPPTATPLPPTATLPPPTETVEASTDDMIAWNAIAAQERGGVHVELARVLIARKAAMQADGIDFSEAEKFNGIDTVGEIIFRITNTTDDVLSVYPDQGTVVVNNEQIPLTEYMFAGATIGDDIGGEIFPGVTVVGGLWFGIKRTDVPDVQKMIVSFNGPVTKDFERRGEDYYFELDLSDHKYEPIPEDLTE